MNFFQHQENARKQSRWIIVAFIIVTLLIVVVIDLIVLAVLSMQTPLTGEVGGFSQTGLSALFSVDNWASNSSLMLVSSGATAGIIGLASLGKIASLSSGGGKVARDMGATLISPDVADPLRRRLYNVVEEISLASGTPVPEVYVMESEPGINAFAAGFTPADAAIAVTKGTLEKLNRSELQGVIAHEFSHIFNGDMRINIRMMGVIFGIMVLAIIGRKFLSVRRHRMSSSKSDNASVIIIIGLALTVVGYIGLFFARWMKAKLSRQREFLADASAVQFTRDPSGITGALKKIAAYNHSSYLKADAEEVSHMLFGSGHRSLMFSTHPPLSTRLKRLEKGFQENEIEKLARKLRAQETREHVQAQLADKENRIKQASKNEDIFFDVDSMIDNIGSPEFERILAAAVLSAEIPNALKSAARSLEWAPEVLFFTLLDDNPVVREKQLLIVVQKMGDISESKLSHLLRNNQPIPAEQRLPLLEICFPNLKRRPLSDIEKILETVNQLATIDRQIDSFEYLLSRLIEKYLRESKSPSLSRLHGKAKLEECVGALSTMVSIVASHGQNSGSAKGLQLAQHAYREGMTSVGVNHTNLSFSDDWQSELDDAIKILDALAPTEKKKIVNALAATVSADKKLVTSEQEMLRAISALIHVPLPLLRKARDS